MYNVKMLGTSKYFKYILLLIQILTPINLFEQCVLWVWKVWQADVNVVAIFSYAEATKLFLNLHYTFCFVYDHHSLQSA